MKGKHYKKWYSRDNMPQISGDTCILLYNEDTDDFGSTWLGHWAGDARRFVIAWEYSDIPDQHPYFVLEAKGWGNDILSAFSATFGPQAFCYDDFVADPTMGFFIARTSTKRKWYHVLFRTEEDRVLAACMMPPHFLI